MDEITLNDCIDTLIEAGDQYKEKDGTEGFKVIVANNKFICIPLKNSIYLNDLSFDMSNINKGISINSDDLPFLILDKSNFGQLKNQLFLSLVNFVESYRQMKKLETELPMNEDVPNKKSKV